MLEALRHDLDFALRGMRRRTGFTATVAGTLALGIGANSTMFGILDRLLLRAPAHIADPDRVVLIHNRGITSDDRQTTQSYGLYKAIAAQVSDFADVAVATPTNLSRRIYYPLGRGMTASQIAGSLVSASYFSTLGVRPAIGRFFLPDEERENDAQKLAVIGYGFWQRHFSGERSAIGQTLELGTAKYTIVGVAPEGFSGTELGEVDVWLPITAADGLRFDRSPNWTTSSSSQWLFIVARLKPGVRPERAAAQATSVYKSWSLATSTNPTPRIRAGIDSQVVDAWIDRAGQIALGLRDLRDVERGANQQAARGRRDRRAADHVRERRKPAARPLAEPAPRDRGAPGARHRASAARDAIVDRRVAARDAGRCRRARRRGSRHARRPRLAARRRGVDGKCRQSSCARVHRGRRIAHRHSHVAGAGAPSEPT